MYFRLLILLSMLLPELAMAVDLFTPVPGDKSMMLLAQVFGGLGSFGAGGSDPMAEGILVFNGACLIVAGILVAYTIIAGTINTAHDGEMLGKKFSSVWVPIRTAMGTALILPVVGGGYCIMQALVGWVIVQGIGLADTVWNKFATTQNIKLIATQGLASNAGSTLGYNLFQSYVCVHSYNAALKQKNDDDMLLLPVGIMTEATKWSSRINTFKPDTTFHFGPKGGGYSGTPENSCGSLDIPTTTTGMSSSNMATQIGSLFNLTEASKAEEAVLKANQDAVKALEEDMNTLAKTLVDGKAPIDPAGIDQAIKKYNDAIAKAASDQAMKLNEFNTLSTSATADGWFMAGAFYTKIAFLTDVIQRAMTNTGTASGPQKLASNNFLNDLMNPDNNNMALTLAGSKAPTKFSFGSNTETNADDDWSLDTILNKLYHAEAFVVDDGEHPLIALKRIGNWVLGILGAATAATLAMSMVKNSTLSWVTDKVQSLFTGVSVGPVIDFVQSMYEKFFLPMLAVGVFLSYILPMMPYMIWLGATIGWLVLCVEAIIAAPMWAVMHLTANGDDMVGSGTQGYRLVLSLMLRPVLMIFGLISAFVLLNVLGGLITKVFFGIFAMSQAESGMFIKVVGLIVAPMMYGFAMYEVIKRTFALIHIIPDELLNWFGGGGPKLGDTAHQMGGEGARQFQFMGNAANYAGNALMSENMKKLDNENKGRKVQSELGLSDKAMKSVNQGSRHNQEMQRGKLASTVNSLGGPNSEDGSRFLREFEKNSENGESFSDSVQGALEHTNNAKYGDQASELIDKFTGGGSESHRSPEYAGITSALNNKLNKFIQTSGGDESLAKEKMSNFMNDVLAEHRERGGSIGKSLKSVSAKYNEMESPVKSSSQEQSSSEPPKVED